ncbi:MAG: type II toxin-antitoxin system RelE/ParE family toxin [Terriglobia bacterium]
MRRDLEGISDYWTAEAGADAALEIVGGIMETTIPLSQQPSAGIAAEQVGSGVRKFPAGNGKIDYRPYRSTEIEVLHVFHGARDRRQAWRGRKSTTSKPC